MSFFTDVIQRDSRYNQATPCHDVNLLEPVFRRQVLSIISDAKAAGIDLRCTETFRSKALQQHYFNIGTSRLRDVGVHHYGLAVDLVEFRNGKPQFDRTDNYRFLGSLAKTYGLIWGGDWGQPNVRHTIYDGYHVQRVKVSDQDVLFAGTWYPNDNYSAVPNVSPIASTVNVSVSDTNPDVELVKLPPANISVPTPVVSVPPPTPSAGREHSASLSLVGNKKIAWDTVARLNRDVFSQWFYLCNVMAFIEIESSFKFDAFRQEPSGVASYGCMQVLDITAAGLTRWGYNGDPTSMYEPTMGITMGMATCCQNWNVLARRLERDPTIEEWVMAYNEGAGGVLAGRRVDQYLNKWNTAKMGWVKLVGDI